MRRATTPRDALDGAGARLLWDAETARKNPKVVVEAYANHGRIVILTETLDEDGDCIGWDLHIPACDGNSVANTIAAATKYLAGPVEVKS